jgi:hypothetical protein
MTLRLSRAQRSAPPGRIFLLALADWKNEDRVEPKEGDRQDFHMNGRSLIDAYRSMNVPESQPKDLDP